MNIPHIMDNLTIPEINPVKAYLTYQNDPELEKLITEVIGSQALDPEILQNFQIANESAIVINSSLQVLSQMLDTGMNVFKESLEKMESIDICQELYVEAEAISPIVRS